MAERLETVEEVRAGAWAEYRKKRNAKIRKLAREYIINFLASVLTCTAVLVGVALVIWGGRYIVDFCFHFATVHGPVAVVILILGVIVVAIGIGFALTETRSSLRSVKYDLESMRERIERGRYNP